MSEYRTIRTNEARRQRARFDAALPLLIEAVQHLEVRPELQSEINCLGLLALTELHLGHLERARALADAALPRILRSRPTGFPSLEGYAAIAEVYRRLLPVTATDRRAAITQRWRSTRRALWKLVVISPVAIPAALFESGSAAALAGRRRIAAVCFRSSARYARDLGMSVEQGAATGALAALSNGSVA